MDSVTAIDALSSLGFLPVMLIIVGTAVFGLLVGLPLVILSATRQLQDSHDRMAKDLADTRGMVTELLENSDDLRGGKVNAALTGRQ